MNVDKDFLNPQALLSLYGEFPSLSGSEIMEVLLKRDEPRVAIKIMTNNKPKNVPARWPKNYDVIYLGVSFIGVRKMIANNWGLINIVDQFNIENSGDLSSVRISCKNDFSIYFDFDRLSVDSLTPGRIGRP